MDDITLGRRERRRLEVVELAEIWEWADHHTLTTPEGAATIMAGHLDTGIPLAGTGAPLVSEFAAIELVAALELSPESGRDYLGKVLELGWRLPDIRAALLQDRCPVFKALRVADLTRALSEDAAWWIDTQLSFAIGTCTWAQVERLVEEAVIRFDPDLAEARRKEGADRRRFDIHLDQTHQGLVPTDGLLDAADAADLHAAITRRAQHLGDLGSTDSLDVRRSVAAGELARADLVLDLHLVDETTGEITRTVPGRKVELHLHLSDAAILNGTLDPDGAVGRWADARSPISAEQVRTWCAQPGTTITVRPVIDLAGHVPVDSYEIPERLKTQVRLRDHSCRFPYCTRRTEACDLDHAQPHRKGGITCPCNLVPLCRKHHRAKTHSEWRYVTVDQATYLWISPNGRHWLVDHRGTRSLDPTRRLDPETMDVQHPWEAQGRITQTVPPCPKAADTAGTARQSKASRPRTGDELRLFTNPPPT
ncbi:MAG TPA: HNH endonuclease signature motif containing protein [Nocardioides sp.]|nr:HNH endonuclease signature motif containing protein [Nocardioides sp.]